MSTPNFVSLCAHSTRSRPIENQAWQLIERQFMPQLIVKEVLRHSQISVTADIYGHVLPSTMRSALDGLDI